VQSAAFSRPRPNGSFDAALSGASDAGSQERRRDTAAPVWTPLIASANVSQVHSGDSYDMACTVAIVAPGEMGAAVAARLGERGVHVTTSLAGRSAASVARAERARMQPAADDEALVDGADFLLSICPPGEAVALAQRLAPALTRARRKPVYVDCNAVSPTTARDIGKVLAPTGCRYADGGIIGPPPPPNSTATRIYVSGAAAHDVARLSDLGVPFLVLDGPVGAASALKMSYGGITKGFTAVAVAMVLGATRAGSADALRKELALSQPHLLAWLTRQVPSIYPKAYRWVAEMEEISHFLQEGTAASDMFADIARLYQDIAEAARAPSAGNAVAQLQEFFVKPDDGQRRAD
jgi:3-hydroxyisobutyrate dehydrogenase-like beta-hydroxyacid dehydrogenase